MTRPLLYWLMPWQLTPVIDCHCIALGEFTGPATLHVNESSATNSMLGTDERAPGFWGDGLLATDHQLAIESMTLDHFLDNSPTKHIDILKMDTQGTELSVLKGAENTLKRDAINMIYTEIIVCPTYQGQNKFYEYLVYLDTFDYQVIGFYNPVIRSKRLMQTDVLFMHSSQLDNIK